MKCLKRFLQQDQRAGDGTHQRRQESGRHEALQPHRDELVQLIIERGIDAAGPVIASARVSYPDSLLFDEGVLNWLGYHFLYWWGR